jgi:hypothetical protein
MSTYLVLYYLLSRTTQGVNDIEVKKCREALWWAVIKVTPVFKQGQASRISAYVKAEA